MSLPNPLGHWMRMKRNTQTMHPKSAKVLELCQVNMIKSHMRANYFHQLTTMTKPHLSSPKKKKKEDKIKPRTQPSQLAFT